MGNNNCEKPYRLHTGYVLQWLRSLLLVSLAAICSLFSIAAFALTSTTTTLSANPNPAYVGQSVTLTATVTGSNPTGTVTFKDGAASLVNVSVVSGTATVNTSFSTAGTHSLTAVYNGDANNATSTSPAVSQTANPKLATTTTLSTNPNPATVSQSVTLTATVSGSSPTGTVTFKDGSSAITSIALSSGTATYNATFSTTGSHSLTAVYNGDVVNATSTSSAVAETVNPVTTTTQLSCPASTTVTVAVNCTVTVSTPIYMSSLSGQSVKIVEGSTTLATGTLSYLSAPSNFKASITLPGSSPPVSVVGAHTLQAQYTATATTTASASSDVSLAVQQRVSTTSLAASPTTAGAGQLVTLAATVTGTAPTGTVTFLDGATPLTTVALSGGQASIDTSFMATGSHSLTASYSGDTNNTGGTSPTVTETVTASGPTSTLLTTSPNPIAAGQSATLTAVVSGASPGGTVTFKDGAITLGSASISGGQATLGPTFATAGNHALTATYRGDTANAASTSGTLTLSVNRANTTTSLVAPATAYQGQNVALSTTVTGASPTGNVTFSEGASTLGTTSVTAGVAVLNTSFSIVGNHSVSASYAGDANNLGSASASVVVQTLPGPVPPIAVVPVVNYEYDALGNPTRTIEAPGVTGFDFKTVATYDSLNRAKDSTDAKLGKTKFGYDGLDRTTQVTDPRNLVTQYPRNGLGDTKQLISPDTGTANLTYDAAGNLKTRTDSRGVLATYSYDALNRLTDLTYSLSGQASISQAWQYDLSSVSNGIGRLGSTTYPGGSWGYAYDPQGWVLGNTQQLNATAGANSGVLTHSVAYEYDAAGHVTGITYPSGRKVSITYTDGVATAIGLAKNTSTAATPLVSAIQWLPFDAARSWVWQMASGTQAHERIFDTSGRVVRYRLGAVLRDLQYDAADRITAYTHYDAVNGAAQPALDQGFGYDELGRLTGITTASASWSIGYDANGNRTSVVLNGSTSAYTTAATSNRLTSVTNPAKTYGYDNAGNATGDSQYSATYDLTGRLSTLTKAGVTTTYTYDSLGRRVRKFSSTGAASTVVFLYDQDGQLLGEYDNTGKAIREYVWFGGAPIAMFTPDPANVANPPLVYYIHTDHLNTPRVVVDKNNAIRWRWMSEPFGVNAAETNPSNLGAFTFNLRMPGQYFDQESGLFYNWHRFYDGGTGRYTQSDPIGLDGGINTYAYSYSNPLSYADPSGLLVDEGGIYLVPAAVATVVTAPAWAVPAGVAAVGTGLYMAITPERCEYDDDKCRKILGEIYRYLQTVNSRIDDMQADQHRLFDFAYDKEIPALAGKGTWVGHFQQVTGWQNGLRNLIREALKYRCKVPREAWEAAYRKIPLRPSRHG